MGAGRGAQLARILVLDRWPVDDLLWRADLDAVPAPACDYRDAVFGQEFLVLTRDLEDLQ